MPNNEPTNNQHEDGDLDKIRERLCGLENQSSSMVATFRELLDISTASLRREISDLNNSIVAANEAKASTDCELSKLRSSSAREIHELRSTVSLLTLQVDRLEKVVNPDKDNAIVAGVYLAAPSIPVNRGISSTEVQPVLSTDILSHGAASCTGQRIELSFYGCPFDKNGLLYLIGCQGETADYVNPHKLHISTSSGGLAGNGDGVVATMSTVGFDCVPYRFVEHRIIIEGDDNVHNDSYVSSIDPNAGENFTKNIPESWMKVDIGQSRNMVVNHYCLRNGDNKYKSFILRNWLFQGSHTGGDKVHEWVTLKRHSADGSLMENKESGEDITADWSIEETEVSVIGYRYFRILQNGLNWGGNHVLACSGIELYGVLFTEKHPC